MTKRSKRPKPKGTVTGKRQGGIPHRELSRRPIHLAIFATVLALLTMPSLTLIPSGGLDPSWQLGLGLALDKHFAWGVQYLWTYGPLGFLSFPYTYPNRLLWIVSSLFTLLTHIAFITSYFMAGLEVIEQTMRKNKYSVTLMVAGALVLTVAAGTLGADFQILLSVMFLELLICLWPKNYRYSTVLLFVLGPLLAIVSMIKSSAYIAAIPEIVIFMVILYKCQKCTIAKLFIPLGSFIISFIGIWIMLGQGLLILVKYLKGTEEIILGYSAAMSLNGAGFQTAWAIVLICCIVGGLVAERLYSSNSRFQRTTFFLGLPIILQVWKEGFVRHDPGLTGGHAMIFFAVMAIISWIIFLAGGYHLKVGSLLPLMSVFIALLFLSYSNIQVVNLDSLKEEASLLGKSSSAKWIAEQEAIDGNLRSSYGITKNAIDLLEKGSVNIVPWDIAIAMAYNLDWDPSPVAQAYSAYSPYLDGLNAEQLASGNGANRILFRLLSIDGRYPPFDEPATFREILRHYKYEFSSGDYTVLKRSSRGSDKVAELGGYNYSFNNWIDVPTRPGSMMFARVSIDQSLLGELTGLAYKNAPVYISFKTVTGVVGPYRFVSATGKDGLFISEFLPDIRTFNALIRGQSNPLLAIQAVKFTTPQSWQYQPNIKVSFDYVPNVLSAAQVVTLRGLASVNKPTLYSFDSINDQLLSEITSPVKIM